MPGPVGGSVEDEELAPLEGAVYDSVSEVMVVEDVAPNRNRCQIGARYGQLTNPG